MGVKGSWSRVKDHKKFEDNYNLITWRNDMEEQDKVCPIMSRLRRDSNGRIYCVKEECMAWGVIEYSNASVGNIIDAIHGCKLIDKQ